MFLELKDKIFIAIRDIVSIELRNTELLIFTNASNSASYIESYPTPEDSEKRYTRLRKELHEKRLIVPF